MMNVFYYNEETPPDSYLVIDQIRWAKPKIKRSLRIILEFFQRNVQEENHMRTSQVIHIADCHQILKRDLEYLKRNFNVTPHNHTMTEWYNLFLKLERDMREAMAMLVAETPDIPNLTWFRNKCIEDILAGNQSKDWFFKRYNEEKKTRDREALEQGPQFSDWWYGGEDD